MTMPVIAVRPKNKFAYWLNEFYCEKQPLLCVGLCTVSNSDVIEGKKGHSEGIELRSGKVRSQEPQSQSSSSIRQSDRLIIAN